MIIDLNGTFSLLAFALRSKVAHDIRGGAKAVIREAPSRTVGSLPVAEKLLNDKVL